MVLKELCLLRGVSGDEDRVRDFVRAHAEKYADSVAIDRMGNLLAFKKGTDSHKHVMLAAHMDEVGFIVVGINDNGLLSYEPVGAIDPRVVVSKPVRVGDSEVPGVIGAKAIHLQTKAEFEKMLRHDDLYIDIGAPSKAEAEKLVQPGDYVTFQSDWREFGDGLVKSKALDDRVGVMALMSVLENEYPCDITCAFTVQEEVGLRGAICAGYNVEADEAIALEGTTANDLGDVPDPLKVCRVGRGVAISFMDRTSIANRPLFQRLRDTAIAAGIPWQLKQFIAGGNDAGAIQLSRGGVPTAVLSVPCRNIHSASSVASFSDIEAQFSLVDRYLRRECK
ncbi:MAG: M42 family metallopeptidase [Clostridiales bacterium]|jgi:putative aminopeptidase FrvX|nr:M42 family metallopeptidase [Clostridiales bacterium]